MTTEQAPHPDSLTRDQLREVLAKDFEALRPTEDELNGDIICMPSELADRLDDSADKLNADRVKWFDELLHPIVATIDRKTALNFIAYLTAFYIYGCHTLQNSYWLQSRDYIQKNTITPIRTALGYAESFVLHLDPARGKDWKYDIKWNRHKDKHNETLELTNGFLHELDISAFGLPPTLHADIVFNKDTHKTEFELIRDQLTEQLKGFDNEGHRTDPRTDAVYLSKTFSPLLYYLSDDHGHPKTFVLEGKKANQNNYAAFICRLFKLPDDMIKRIVKYYKPAPLSPEQ